MKSPFLKLFLLKCKRLKVKSYNYTWVIKEIYSLHGENHSLSQPKFKDFLNEVFVQNVSLSNCHNISQNNNEIQQLREDKYCHVSFTQFGGNFIFIFVATLLTGFAPINTKHYICLHLQIWSSMFNILCVINQNSNIQYHPFYFRGALFYSLVPSIMTMVHLSQCTVSQSFLTKAIE